MAGYEAYSLFADMVANLNTILFGYISVLSAFLLMSYFAADRLNTLLMVIVLVLFTSTCFTFIFQVNLIKAEMASLYSHMLQLKDEGDSSLQWLGENSPQAVGVLTVFHNLITVGGYLGSMTFFFWRRYHHPEREGHIT